MRRLSPSSPVFPFLNACSLFKGFIVTFPSSIALAFLVLDILDCPLWGRRGFGFLFLCLVSARLHFLCKQCVHNHFCVTATYSVSRVGNTTFCTSFYAPHSWLSTISLIWVSVFVCVTLSTPNAASASPFSSVLQLSFPVLGILSSLSLIFPISPSFGFQHSGKFWPLWAWGWAHQSGKNAPHSRNPAGDLHCLLSGKYCLFLPVKVFLFCFCFSFFSFVL